MGLLSVDERVEDTTVDEVDMSICVDDLFSGVSEVNEAFQDDLFALVPEMESDLCELFRPFEESGTQSFLPEYYPIVRPRNASKRARAKEERNCKCQKARDAEEFAVADVPCLYKRYVPTLRDYLLDAIEVVDPFAMTLCQALQLEHSAWQRAFACA